MGCRRCSLALPIVGDRLDAQGQGHLKVADANQKIKIKIKIKT